MRSPDWLTCMVCSGRLLSSKYTTNRDSMVCSDCGRNSYIPRSERPHMKWLRENEEDIRQRYLNV